MSRRTAMPGLALLFGIALAALYSSSAFAGATAFTCLEGAGEHNANVDCVPGSTGSAGREAIPEETLTSLTPKKLSNPVLEGKLFGATVSLEATGVECVECTLQNKEVAGVMEVAGSGGRLRFTGVSAVGLPKCNVNGGTITTEKLKFTTTVGTEATLEPEAGTKLAGFNITGEGCVVAGNGITVTGKVKANVNGARLSINVTKAALELQLEGERAALRGEGTSEAGNGVMHHPISMSAAVGATAFVCVPGAGEHNTNADCEPGSTGGSGHEAVAEEATTTLRIGNLVSPILEGRLFGALVKLEATGVECVECTLQNKEVAGVMEVTGSGGRLKFTGVNVLGQGGKCTVVGSATGTITTEKLKLTTTASSAGTVEPESGSLLAEFSVTGKECPVAGSGIKVTGKVFVATSGAKLNVNVTKSSLELLLEGEKAALRQEATIEAGSSTTRHPASLTSSASGTTGVTCVTGGSEGVNKFSDADCTSVSGSGGFGHAAIAPAASTTLFVKPLMNPVLTGSLLGMAVELTSTGVECFGCAAENKEVAGVMEVTGTGGKLKFTGVRVVGLESKCTVVGSATETITTERLKFTTTSVVGATVEPASGTVLAVFDITGAECPVAAENIGITGKAAATLNGAKMNVNVTKASEELKVRGEKASLKGEWTIEASSGYHPLALTTA